MIRRFGNVLPSHQSLLFLL